VISLANPSSVSAGVTIGSVKAALNGFIHVQVDPGAPSAWRKQPYYDQLRQWAKNNLQKGIRVIVLVNDTATLIMPDQDVPLGPVRPSDGISVAATSLPASRPTR